MWHPRTNWTLVGILALSILLPNLGFGQGADVNSTALRVELVFANYDGDKLTSRLPYAMLVNATDGPQQPAHLRMGIEIPITSEGKVHYRNVGTNISCQAERKDNGHYFLRIQIERSSLLVQSGLTPSNGDQDSPPFRTLSSEHSAVLKDGQTLELVAATDPVSGETSRVEVSVKVLE